MTWFFLLGTILTLYDGFVFVLLLVWIRRERKEQDPKYLELCRRFLSDAQDFSEDNLKKAGIEKRFFNNGAFEDCLSEMKRYIELYKEQ